jgi:hypothetical protein
MINIQITEDELNTLLQALYVLEDQEWFRGQDKTNPLVEKFNQFLPDNNQEIL